MDSTIAKQKKTCFVISRIGSEGSLERYLADLVWNDIILKSLNEPTKDYDVVRIDREGLGGSIVQGIVDTIRTADLVIADLTGLSPNAMYELGISHAWNLPVILIALKGLTLPFDIKELDTVFYELPTNKKHCKKAIKEIKKRMSNIAKKKHKNVSFEQAIAAIGKSYSMDGVAEAFADALNDMHKSLGLYKHDLRYNDVWGKPDTIEPLAQGLRQTFKTLSDKIHPFQTIVRGRDAASEPADKYLFALLDKAGEFADDAISIDKLFEGNPTLVKRRRLQQKISEVMLQIEQIAKKLKTRERSSS